MHTTTTDLEQLRQARSRVNDLAERLLEPTTGIEAAQLEAELFTAQLSLEAAERFIEEAAAEGARMLADAVTGGDTQRTAELEARWS